MSYIKVGKGVENSQFKFDYVMFYIMVQKCAKNDIEVKTRIFTGGVGNFGIFEECLMTEEYAYGCSGIVTAMLTTSNLGVSWHTKFLGSWH